MSILDRYIIKQFLGTLIFSIGALSIIFLIVNVLESLDKFIDQKVDISIIFSYDKRVLSNKILWQALS
jgi:lipopolysaccharide export LptBFGC system permease protein LptF